MTAVVPLFAFIVMHVRGSKKWNDEYLFKVCFRPGETFSHTHTNDFSPLLEQTFEGSLMTQWQADRHLHSPSPSLHLSRISGVAQITIST